MSWQGHFLNLALRTTVKPVLEMSHDPETGRRALNLAAPFLFRVPAFTCFVHNREARLAWVQNRCKDPRHVVLYFHGGGYVAGNPKTHLALTATLARLTGAQVCAPDYRLAHQAGALAAFKDAVAAYRHLLSRGYRPEGIVMGGDSAGGGLMLALLAWTTQNECAPAGAFAFSPWTDLTGASPTLVLNADTDPMLPADRLDDLLQVVLDGSDPYDWRTSPLFAEYDRPPPVHIQVSQDEILYADSLSMAERLRQMGGQVTLDEWVGLPHVWQIFHGFLPEADQALADTARFIRERFPSGWPAES